MAGTEASSIYSDDFGATAATGPSRAASVAAGSGMQPQQPPPPAPSQAGGTAGFMMQGFNRGMDGSLAKTMPDLRGLSKDNYRTIRKKIQLFAKARQRRGNDAISEGALALFQSLEGLAWSACEEMDLDLLDQPSAFDSILLRLDGTFQYDVDDEKPVRIEELVNQFYRNKNETIS